MAFCFELCCRYLKCGCRPYQLAVFFLLCAACVRASVCVFHGSVYLCNYMLAYFFHDGWFMPFVDSFDGNCFHTAFLENPIGVKWCEIFMLSLSSGILKAGMEIRLLRYMNMKCFDQTRLYRVSASEYLPDTLTYLFIKMFIVWSWFQANQKTRCRYHDNLVPDLIVSLYLATRLVC